jgi:hypothetical protein
MTELRREPDPHDKDEEGLPEGTETVIWAASPHANSGWHLNNPRDYSQYLPDDLDLSDTEKGLQPTIIYEPGDEIPLPVAEDYFADWDEMIAFDADGTRLGESSRRQSEEAVRLWRDRQGRT